MTQTHAACPRPVWASGQISFPLPVTVLSMSLRTFSLLFGIVFLAIGGLGFVPGFLHAHDNPAVAVDGGLGLLFGLFPVNWLYNLVHIVFGVWGLGVACSPAAGRTYGKSVAVNYALLTLMGLLPFLNTTLGLVPIHDKDIQLHALLAAVAANFGFAYRSNESRVRGAA